MKPRSSTGNTAWSGGTSFPSTLQRTGTGLWYRPLPPCATIVQAGGDGPHCPVQERQRWDTTSREPLAQLVEHRPFKPRVVGSIPTRLTLQNVVCTRGIHSALRRRKRSVRFCQQKPYRSGSPTRIYAGQDRWAYLGQLCAGGL